jgi:hypothetical protein
MDYTQSYLRYRQKGICNSVNAYKSPCFSCYTQKYNVYYSCLIIFYLERILAPLIMGCLKVFSRKKSTLSVIHTRQLLPFAEGSSLFDCKMLYTCIVLYTVLSFPLLEYCNAAYTENCLSHWGFGSDCWLGATRMVLMAGEYLLGSSIRCCIPNHKEHCRVEYSAFLLYF